MKKNETAVEPFEMSKMDSKINEVAERLVAALKPGEPFPRGPEIYKGLLEIEPDKQKLTYELEEKLYDAIRKAKKRPVQKAFSPNPLKKNVSESQNRLVLKN